MKERGYAVVNREFVRGVLTDAVRESEWSEALRIIVALRDAETFLDKLPEDDFPGTVAVNVGEDEIVLHLQADLRHLAVSFLGDDTFRYVGTRFSHKDDTKPRMRSDFALDVEEPETWIDAITSILT